MAAYTCGIDTVLIPADNVKDLEKIDAEAREHLHFVPCKSVREVLEIIRAFHAEAVQIACLADRSHGRVDFGVPFTALAQVDMHFYPADECPLCQNGVPMSPARGEPKG